MDKVYVIGRDVIPQSVGAGRITLVALPGTSGEVSLDVILDRPDQEFDLAGLYLCAKGDKLKIKINLRHQVGSCHSNQLMRGIVSGGASATFDGLVYVAPGAAHTKAYQTVNNLLLSEGAIAESRPQLEIYNDDVECSHGATSGFLNADEQFYMRSRGITEQEARRLQMISFIAPVAARLDDNLKQEVYEAVSECQD